MTPYERFCRQQERWAELWEHVAEVARTVGNLELAHSSADLATKLRYLAEPDPDVEEAFNRAAVVGSFVE